jgi:hypothetical protein
MAIKKNVWKHVKLDEHRFWGEEEDSNYSLRFTAHGFVHRANPYSKLHTLIEHEYCAPIYPYNPKGIGKPVDKRGFLVFIMQVCIDICVRAFDLKFLRFRRKVSLFLKKFMAVKAPIPGDKK